MRLIAALVIGMALGFILGAGLPAEVICHAGSEVPLNRAGEYPAWLLDCSPTTIRVVVID